MTILTILAADTPPVSRAEMMAQLHLDPTADADQLALLDERIWDAVEYVEGETNLRLAPVDLEQRLDCWPADRRIVLDAAPVRGVDAVQYVDPDGVLQALDAGEWLFVPETVGGEVWLAAGFRGPALAPFPGSIRIQFSAGSNSPASTGSSDGDPRLNLPRAARQAIVLVAATWFVDRDADAASIDGVERLINLCRRYV